MIYVDLLVLQDLIYNYVILLGVSILLTRQTTIKKIFLSSIIGTIPIILLFMNISNILNLVTSFAFSIIMSIIAFSYKNILYTTKNIIYMYMTSIFIGGSIYLININFIYNIDNYPINTIILILLSPIITFIYIKSIDKIKTDYSNYYKVDIYINDKEIISTTAFLDTGNKLIDPYKSRPIILVNKNLIDIEKRRKLLIPYHTLNNKDILECIIPKQIYIHNIGYRKKFLIGLMNEVNIEGVDCILNAKILERI